MIVDTLEVNTVTVFDEESSGEEVDCSNNKLVIVIGVLSWLIIIVANVYVIVELCVI